MGKNGEEIETQGRRIRVYKSADVPDTAPLRGRLARITDTTRSGPLFSQNILASASPAPPAPGSSKFGFGSSSPSQPTSLFGLAPPPQSNPNDPAAAQEFMRANIAKVSERGYRHEGIAATSSNLHEQSKMFYKQAKKSSFGGLFGVLFGGHGSSQTAAAAPAAKPSEG